MEVHCHLAAASASMPRCICTWALGVQPRTRLQPAYTVFVPCSWVLDHSEGFSLAGWSSTPPRCQMCILRILWYHAREICIQCVKSISRWAAADSSGHDVVSSGMRGRGARGGRERNRGGRHGTGHRDAHLRHQQVGPGLSLPVVMPWRMGATPLWLYIDCSSISKPCVVVMAKSTHVKRTPGTWHVALQTVVLSAVKAC